ncbi:MAG TPA: glycoside hydrolase family 66 protein [Galbitalea sp.]|jgi:dextranase|nr:glycoside hydrolase family 66 protein [Galbitalea sp.]
MTGPELLPTRATYAAGDSIVLEVREAVGPGEVVVRHLGDEVLRAVWDGTSSIVLGWLPVGTYGIELVTSDAILSTAVEVAEIGRSRLRYGFVVDYSPGRDLSGISDTIRRLHLNGIQFYDWAYRHANLLGGGAEYRDALDQPISLATVRDLIAAVKESGASAVGYAAVYAVGPAEWDEWKHRALLTATGEPYALEDFLFLVDPAAPDWLESFSSQLSAAASDLGFSGFHLDQYGYPKRATRADGETIDVATSFTAMIAAVRERLPSAHLVFNNVNDFPTWATASAPLDAVYIEPWEPTVTLGSLGSVVSRARSVAAGKPIVIAAYQHVYDSATAVEADLATSFTMATLFSHGATQLLAGETDRILVDPYYVRNHVIEPSTSSLLKRWYDFLVEHDELLLEPSIVDATSSYVGAYNSDCDVEFDSATTSDAAVPGSVWRRVTLAGDRLVVHLINLLGQDDALWDAPRKSPGRTGAGRLRFRRVGHGVPRVRVADPDGIGRLVDVTVELDGDHATAVLPELSVWQLVVIDPGGAS